MAFDHPTLLFRNLIEHEKHLPKFLDPCWPPPISPPPPHKHRSFSSVSIILICVFSGCFLLISYYVILAKYCSRRNNNSTQNPTQPNPNHNDYLDENQRPAVVDHPIWLINTVGLSNSIINSISACKYKKGDGLIEGTDCSVCLTEFQEDENLRLLPKCNHAFHINCIDTWLRSHKNCPLCRAPIVASVASNSNETEGNSSNLDGQIENLEVEEEGNEEEEEEEEERELDVQEGRSNEEVAKETLDSRELQIVDGNCSNLEREQVVEEGMQPVRRSVSLDSSAIASIFCFSVGNSSVQEEGKGSSGIEAIGTKKSNLGIIAKNTGSSSGIFRLMGACSSFRGFSSSSQEKHASMKRSLSSGGKFLFSRGGRSQSSILPL